MGPVGCTGAAPAAVRRRAGSWGPRCPRRAEPGHGRWYFAVMAAGGGRSAGPGAPGRVRHSGAGGAGLLGPAAVARPAGGRADVDAAAVVGVLAVGDRRPAAAHDGGQLPLDRAPLP